MLENVHSLYETNGALTVGFRIDAIDVHLLFVKNRPVAFSVNVHIAMT